MLRSFQYAASSHLLSRAPRVTVGHDEESRLQQAAGHWCSWVSAVFLGSYIDVASEGGLLPKSRDQLNVLLRAFLLERCVAEMSHELADRPDWLGVPLGGIAYLLRTGG
jgi:maltose alpha-D-glucosyltransferase/alpha-amylase